MQARRPLDNIYKHGEIYGIPGYTVDGNDVVEMYETTQKAVQFAREGGGPSLIEARTFRMMQHCGPNEDKNSGSRNPEDWQEWKANCPVKQFENYCLEHNLLSSTNQESIRKNIAAEIKTAFEFALSGEDAVNTE